MARDDSCVSWHVGVQLLCRLWRHRHNMPLHDGRRFFIGNWNQSGFLAEGRQTRTLREILGRLRETYSGSIGFEVGHKAGRARSAPACMQWPCGACMACARLRTQISPSCGEVPYSTR